MDKIVIDKKIAELKAELRKARFDISLNKLQDTCKIRKTRKEIARLFTERNQPERKK